MSPELKDTLNIIGIAAVIIALVRFTIPYKIKRVIRKCEFVQNNLNNKNVKKFIRYLRTNSIIGSPQIGQALCETQLIINDAEHIDGELKLQFFDILMRKKVMGIQVVSPVYVDKNGKRIE
jgi:hypothetical protein